MLKVLLNRPFHSFGIFSQAVRSWSNQILIAVFGFLLAKAALMGELYPFGTSFLAAVCIIHPRLRQAALAGVLAGTMVATKGWQTASYVFGIILLYLVINKKTSDDNYWFVVPGLVAAVQLLARGATVLFLGNELYQWVEVAFESIFAAVLTLVAISGLKAYPRMLDGEYLTTEERTSLGVIIIGVLLGVSQIECFGVGFQSVISRWLILWGAFLSGPGGGAAIGVCVGLVPSIQGNLTTGPIAIYALAGLLGGLFNNFKKIGVIIGFALVVMFMSLYFSERVIIEQALRETVLAVLLFLIFNIPGIKIDTAYRIPKELLLKQDNNSDVVDKLNKMASVFYELGKTFQIKDQENREKEELNEVFNNVASKVCDGCSLYRVCWEQDFYKTYRAILDACTVLETKGVITEKQFGASLKRRCVRLRELTISLNSQLDQLKLIDSYKRQISACREMVNKQLNNMAKVIEDFSDDIKHETYISGIKGEAVLKNKLEEKGIAVKDIYIRSLPNGSEEIVISQAGCKEKDWCKTMVAPNISQISGKSYRIKSTDCIYGENHSCTCRLVLGNSYHVRVGQAQCPKDGLDISGDVCTSFQLSDQRYALVMSDGMGAGQEAHIESEIAINLLENLLMAGFSPETAIKTINTVLVLRSGRESFVTLDIVIINTVNGFAEFVKIGGAPSLISTANGLSLVQALSPPAGILDKIEMQTFKHLLIPGNVIIMMSDGVWEAINSAGGPAGWFEDVLQRMDLENPQQIADNILYLAKKAAGSKAQDDMCVQVARLEAQKIA